MISHLSSALKRVLEDPSLPDPLGSALVAFDPPTETYSPGSDTVNLFLYDIRENVELRSNEPALRRQNGQVIIEPPPLRVACSYLITAWSASSTTGEIPILKEHQLLSQVLRKLSLHPTIPAQFLQNSLVNQEPPLPMVTARADGLENPSEFWTSLGNRLRPSLKVTVTISMDVFESETAPIVITEDMRLGERTAPDEEQVSPATLERYFRIGGQVTDNSGVPVADTIVTIVELGLVARTDSGGRYIIGMMPAGTYHLNISGQTFTITVPATAGQDYNVQLT